VAIFAEDARAAFAALEAAVAKGDADSVGRISHTLKGSSSNMGALRMAQICAELESVGASKDLTPAGELLEELVAEFERAHSSLVAELRREI
jgi:two-component system sensor histidine kinase/response regulator